MRLLPLLIVLLLAGCDADSPHGPGSSDPPVTPEPVLRTLSVQREGIGSVVSNPPGIDCGSDCSERYPDRTVVTLTATAPEGQSFAGWSGDCSGNASLCLLRMDRDLSVKARFEPAPPGSFPLTVERRGEGRVTSTPAGIDCGEDCREDYAAGTEVSLAATPASGWSFDGWNGDCSGRSECRVTLSAARNVEASFTELPPVAPVGSWLGGDMHVHTDHSSDGSALRQGLDGRGPGNVSVADQIGQGVQRGLDWMPITDHRTYVQHYDPLWESADLLLIPGEEANGSPHANPIGAVDWIVQPGNYPGRPSWSVLQGSIWDAHSQGAVWSHNHPDDGHLNDDGTPNERANAVGADTVEIWNRASGIEAELKYAEDRWNAGYRFGGVGASDNHFRELWAIAGPGQPRTGVFASEASERAILDALGAGRIRISGGQAGVGGSLLAPELTLEADLQGDGVYEAIAGDEVVVPAGTAGTLRLRIENAIGATVRVYRNPGKSAGAMLAEFTPFQAAQIHEIDISAEAGQTWYYAEARGPGLDAVNTGDIAAVLNPVNLADARLAITAPIFLGPSLAAPQGAEPLPADAGGEDGALKLLGEPGRYAGFPDLAVSSGVRHVVAEVHEPGATRVHYRRVAADGSASTPVDLAPDSRSARFPRIAARGGAVWVVWQDERAGQVPRRPAIYLRQSNDGGLSWQPERLIRSIDGRAERPAIALTPDGQPVLAWQEIRADQPFDVFVQQLGRDAEPMNLSRAGKSFTAGNPLDTRSAIYPASVWPSLAVRADGLVALAYHDDRSDPDPLWTGQTGTGDSADVDNWQIRIHTRAAGAAGWSEGVTLGADDRADRHPSLAFAGDGSLHCVWDMKTLDASGANLSIRQARSTDGGASFTVGEMALGADEGASGQYPRLAPTPDGGLRAVWYDNRASDWRWRVMTARWMPAPGWDAGRLLMGRGINTWPANDQGQIVFASTRNAQRLQRDRTQQIFLLALP